jgi:hypothetical protein
MLFGCVCSCGIGAGLAVLDADAGLVGGGRYSGPFWPQPLSAVITRQDESSKIDRRMAKFPEEACSIAMQLSALQPGRVMPL